MHEHLHDLGPLVGFLLGILLYFNLRAGKAMRAKNAIGTRADYFRHNWDIMLYSAAVEVGFLWLPFAHLSAAQIAGFFGASAPEWVPAVPANFATCFLLGLVSDYIRDQASVSPRVPDVVKKFIAEQIPKLPENGEGTT